MVFTAEQIAAYTGGTVEGNKLAEVTTFAKIEEGVPGALSFLANMKYESFLYETKSSVVLVGRDFQPSQPVDVTLVRVDNPYESVAKLLQLYESMQQRREGISSLAFIDPSAQVGEGCYVGPFVAIGEGAVVGDHVVLHPHVTIGKNARVGNNTEIYSNAVIYHDCQVGQRCILHAGCVIGADGFGFAPPPEGYEKIPQSGIVVIEDDVEIGANTCVDRSTMGATVVHKGVKLDNLIQIAHNCEVGENTVMSAQVGLAGSTKIGAWCMAGGQAGFSGHIKISDKTFIGAQAGVISNTKGGERLLGAPAIDAKEYMKASAIFRRLPDIYRELGQLKKELEELKKAKE